MIVESVLFNLHDLDPETAEELKSLHCEKVVLPGPELTKRIQRLSTDHGRELGLRLPAGSGDLRDGDVLLREETNLVMVSVLPTDVLIIKPADIGQALFTAHSLGNRHLQAQFLTADGDDTAHVMVVQYDHTVESFLASHGVAYERRDRVMPAPFRHAEHTH
ncbi:urease accessory protein UreE [Arthrobacter agilis]|uniref:urease accessory protein UreE n=1 Tax=Arthrobacter agilis TaxID=37921 RepID=UPI002367115C|nr:urease accessory protein UreE [Arthrobacter agilis]WDF33243.1 urease accessory protein UreE [Arthrobacter agilis]